MGVGSCSNRFLPQSFLLCQWGLKNLHLTSFYVMLLVLATLWEGLFEKLAKEHLTGASPQTVEVASEQNFYDISLGSSFAEKRFKGGPARGGAIISFPFSLQRCNGE